MADIKTTKSSTKTFPTGLVPGWQSKMSKTSHVTGNQVQHLHQCSSSPLGGFSDDDADGQWPSWYQHKTLKNEVCPNFSFWSNKRLLIHSVGIKLILVNDSDPNFIEYAKPKPKVKVSVFSSVYNYMGTDTSYRRLWFMIVIWIS